MLWAFLTIGVIAAVILADQISKILVLAYLFEDQVTLVEGVLRFTYVENRGMAFGLLADHRWVFIVASVLGIGFMAFYLFRYVRRTLSRVGLALVVGGGIGNMIDRLRLGFVVDFIDFYAFDFWMWVFNIADAAVTVGGVLFALDLILELVGEIKAQKGGKAGADNEQGGLQ